jgi:hypothetical protein
MAMAMAMAMQMEMPEKDQVTQSCINAFTPMYECIRYPGYHFNGFTHLRCLALEERWL